MCELLPRGCTICAVSIRDRYPDRKTHSPEAESARNCLPNSTGGAQPRAAYTYEIGATVSPAAASQSVSHSQMELRLRDTMQDSSTQIRDWLFNILKTIKLASNDNRAKENWLDKNPVPVCTN